MLPYTIRKALFFLFVGIFLISAPLVVLYTAGYRFNRTNSTVLQTGTLAIASTPKNATLEINGERINDTTPTVLQRLSPGARTVRLTKNGYHAWERTISVQSGATAYITAPLFLAQQPILLAQSGTDWERALTTRPPRATPPLPNSLLFTSTSAGIEVSFSSRFLALLPHDLYTPVLFDEKDLFVKNNKGELFFISLTSAQGAQLLGKDMVTSAWSTSERLFIWTDGLEVHLFAPATNTQELITRQSDPITALSFAHEGESIVIASVHNLLGIDLTPYADGRMQTPLALFTEPTTVWFSQDGDIAYLETPTQFFSLALTH